MIVKINEEAMPSILRECSSIAQIKSFLSRSAYDRKGTWRIQSRWRYIDHGVQETLGKCCKSPSPNWRTRERETGEIHVLSSTWKDYEGRRRNPSNATRRTVSSFVGKTRERILNLCMDNVAMTNRVTKRSRTRAIHERWDTIYRDDEW